MSFPTEVLPILTHAGCNSGACHGAATGQGGFRLSLLGYDPESDHARITREFGGRRIDLDSPEDSLFLRKPTMQVDHEGGRRLRVDSNSYRKLRQWIAGGAPYGSRDLRVVSIEVAPADAWRATTNEAFQLKVTAHLSNGSSQDATALALYSSSDDAVAEVSRSGEVTTRGRGITSIMVRYGGQVGAVRVAVPFHDETANLASFEGGNFIDAHMAELWRRLGLEPSALSSDSEFLRRVYLDLIGRLPTSEECRALLGTGSSLRREQVIETLLQTGDFVDFWTLKLADLLLVGGQRGQEAGARIYHQWLREQVAASTGWDRIVRDLVTAEGDITTTGPANFAMLASDPRDLAEQVGSIFLGTQIACARCHAHPSDRWTREDYHRFAAYFARIQREGNRVGTSSRGEVDDPRSGQPLTPKALGAGAVDPEMSPDTDRREALAEWMTAPGNPFLARTFVNRTWKHLFGRGLVEPVNDLRPTNPATHPELLEDFARRFVAQGWDLRWLVRQIASSRTYQLGSRATPRNLADERFHSRAYLKPLPAQVFVDAIAQVTGVADEYEGYSAGTRAVQLVDARVVSYALDVLGRCQRQQDCTGATAGTGGGLAQALHLINGATIHEKLDHGIIEKFLQSGASHREIIEEIYLRALTRWPDPAEREFWEEFLAGTTNLREGVEDFLWAVLNSREFAFNH